MTAMKKAIWMLIVGATAMLANEITDQRTPTRRGGGGDGKCTIEVEVDDVAEVEILGNQAQIRTMSGGAATFRRFECNQDIPNNPNDFRFEGIAGRGRQTLVRMPGRGPAVIRIEDSRGGRHGYTFDIFWRGAAGPWNNSNGNSGGFGGGRGNSGIFGPGNGNGGGFGNNGGSAWNRDLSYRGRGSGNLRSDRGGNESVYNCQMSIGRNGGVEIAFDTDSGYGIVMRGRVNRTDGNWIYADLQGNGGGTMEIETDGGNRVRQITMRGGRFELQWRN